MRRLLFPLLFLFALLTSKISPAYVVAVVLGVLWFVEMRRARRRSPALSAPPFLLAVLLALFTALSTLFSRDPATSVKHLAGVGLFLLIPVVVDLVDSIEKARSILLALGASGVVLGLIGIWEYVHGADDLENRIRGTLSSWMTLSGLTMTAGCVLAGFVLEGRGRFRWIGLAAIVPFTAMVLTFTRNAYVGTLAALLAYFVVRRPRRMVLLLPVLVLVFVLLPKAIRGRAESILSVEERTNRDRIAMAHAGFRMIRESPVFGIGPEMIKLYYALYRDPQAPQWRVGHLHDNVLQLAAANGLFAAAAYLALMGLFFARTIRALRRENRPDRAALLAGALLAGVALFVAGFFEYNFGDTEVEMATLVIIAIPFSKAFA